MSTPRTLWMRFRRAILLAACAGRTREHAAGVLGIGLRTMQQEVRDAGFRRDQPVAPDPADVELLLVLLDADTPAMVQQRIDEIRREHAEQIATLERRHAQQSAEARQRHLANLRWLTARHTAERRRLEAKVKSLLPIQTTDPRPWSQLTRDEREQRLLTR